MAERRARRHHDIDEEDTSPDFERIVEYANEGHTAAAMYLVNILAHWVRFRTPDFPQPLREYLAPLLDEMVETPDAKVRQVLAPDATKGRPVGPDLKRLDWLLTFKSLQETGCQLAIDAHQRGDKVEAACDFAAQQINAVRREHPADGLPEDWQCTGAMVKNWMYRSGKRFS